MSNLTGNDLETYGRSVFEGMKLICINPLNQVQIKLLNPSGPYNSNEHLEMDYLIPINDVCVVGEITSRSDPKDLQGKYTKFKKHFNILSSMDLTSQYLWEQIGVPKDKLKNFRRIRSLKGIFIDTSLQRFDVSLQKVPNIVLYFKAEWELLVNYVSCIGEYSKHLFLDTLKLQNIPTRRPFEISEGSNCLIRSCDKKIASGTFGLSDLFSFEASPYEILPYACVYRHDILPNLDSSTPQNYQRPLIPEKLAKIRENLLTSEDFMFPNSILVVLSKDCKYLEDSHILRIPDNYGAISVIDGQHRLFSYADIRVKDRIGDDSKIMVTAIKFHTDEDRTLQRYSAKAFIEINSTQTPVKSSHIDAIAFPILGEVYPKAIAAQVILMLNERGGKKLYGLFDTNQTSLGKIQTSTVITVLQSLTNISYIKSIKSAKRGNRIQIKQGYEKLFADDISNLDDPEILINNCVIAIERFFNLLAQAFSHDWISRDNTNGSSLEFTKFFSAFIRLFRQFIEEGLDWDQVKRELNSIRTNLMLLRNITTYNSILFDPNDKNIPNASPSVSHDFRFLNNNRVQPTSILTILPVRK
jgi:DGQHR domain-containing protein